MALLRRVRENVDARCIVRRCRKQGCTVSMTGAPSERIIVDLDREGAPIGTHERRCDYLFFGESAGQQSWFAPLELKGGRLRGVRAIVAQLQAGADIAESLVPGSLRPLFEPVAVLKGSHKAQRDRLKRSEVRFRGVVKRVKLQSCGSPLASVFSR